MLVPPFRPPPTSPSTLSSQHVFVTGGSEGSFTIWDKDKRTRYKENKPVPQTPVTAIQWNPQGNMLAFARGYDWNKGCEAYDLATCPTKLTVQITTPERDFVTAK